MSNWKMGLRYGMIELFKADAGWVFVLISPNGKTMYTSQAYSTKQKATDGLQRFQWIVQQAIIVEKTKQYANTKTKN